MVEELLASTPFEIVLVDFGKSGKEWKLTVFIDHPEGITLDHCQRVSHLITEALEERDPSGWDQYRIEVSSPGVDRPLTKRADYERFLHERVQIKTHRPIGQAKTFIGELRSCTQDSIEVIAENGGQSVQIPFDIIAKATLKPILNFS